MVGIDLIRLHGRDEPTPFSSHTAPVTAASPSLTSSISGLANCRMTRPSRRNTKLGQSFTRNDRPSGRLIALVVAERFRRRGVARALVRRAEVEARALGCSRIILTSADHREDAHAFYLAAGYEQTGRRFAKDLDAEAASRLGA